MFYVPFLPPKSNSLVINTCNFRCRENKKNILLIEDVSNVEAIGQRGRLVESKIAKNTFILIVYRNNPSKIKIMEEL